MKCKQFLCICLSLVIFSFFSLIFVSDAAAQERLRIVPTPNNQTPNINEPQISQPPQTTKLRTQLKSSSPILTNQLTAANSNYKPLIKKTSSSQPTNPIPSAYIAKVSYGAPFNQRLLNAIQMRIGVPYRYGSTGPTSYDCSGLVWSVFQDAGFYFERSSARTLWQNSQPVEGVDKYIMGTLVFFNGLGHIGIVADTEGFYHASSSQGVTYSKFDGYWGKRIVGFRRINLGS